MLGLALDGDLLAGRMRETLEAWLVTGSYVGRGRDAAGVHEQTVRQRLRRLEMRSVARCTIAVPSSTWRCASRV